MVNINTITGIFGRWSLKTRITLFTLSIFVISIWALSYYAIHMLKADMQNMLGVQQTTAVSHSAANINQDLEHRITVLGKVAGIITPAIIKDKTALQKLLEQRLILQDPFNGGVIALGVDGTVIADLPPSSGRISINYMDRDYIASVLKNGKPAIGAPVIGKKPTTPALGIAVPIFDKQGAVIGALVGVTNLDKPSFLDKIIQHGYGKSGYYLLIEPKSRMIVTGTDKGRIMGTLPAKGTNRLIDRHIDGFNETGITLSSLGVEVLTSSKQIPVSGWFLAASLPIDEAFAPIRTMQLRIFIITIFLTLIAGALTWWMLKLQLYTTLSTLETLTSMSDTNQSFQLLPVTRNDEIGQLVGGFNHLLKTLKEREEQLKILNEKLTAKVEEEVTKRLSAELRQRQEREALIQSSKMAELGNMLGAIIHQWKQPLNTIAIDVQDIKYAFNGGELNAKAIDEFIASVMDKIKFMSKTADDFRDFYKPSKEKKLFSVIEQVESVAQMLGKQLNTSNINLRIEGDKTIYALGFTSEFKQVVLNIINNAKDVLVDRQIKNAAITVTLSHNGQNAVLTITDNAGGISSDLLPQKLFEPFISTKGAGGTGIGLSLSRIIIEESMQGKLSAKNVEDGACFMIELPISA